MSSFQWIPKAVLSTCQPKVKQTSRRYLFLICKQFSREIEVCQNIVNKSDNFSREIEVCQNNLGIYVSPRYITVNLPEQL